MQAIENETGFHLLTPDEAAKALRISVRTLRDMTDAGEVPSVRFGRAVRYDPADLQTLANSKKQVAKGNEDVIHQQ